MPALLDKKTFTASSGIGARHGVGCIGFWQALLELRLVLHQHFLRNSATVIINGYQIHAIGQCLGIYVGLVFACV